MKLGIRKDARTLIWQGKEELAMARVINVPDIFNQAEFLVDRHLREGRAENIAIYYEGQKITYAELAAMVNRRLPYCPCRYVIGLCLYLRLYRGRKCR